mmetsp:Transcript_3958/g.5517  ORF Transcript_3958/g.5517 Transcript_3958/m.5517 type:complete len:274 (+) Transcript_3958:2-823(+)
MKYRTDLTKTVPSGNDAHERAKQESREDLEQIEEGLKQGGRTLQDAALVTKTLPLCGPALSLSGKAIALDVGALGGALENGSDVHVDPEALQLCGEVLCFLASAVDLLRGERWEFLSINFDFFATVEFLTELFPRGSSRVPKSPALEADEEVARPLVLGNQFYLQLPSEAHVPIHGLCDNLRHSLLFELHPTIAFRCGGLLVSRQSQICDRSELLEESLHLGLVEAIWDVTDIDEPSRDMLLGFGHLGQSVCLRFHLLRLLLGDLSLLLLVDV